MKTAGAEHRADKQKAENVFPAGKLPFNVVTYILNDPVFQSCSQCREGQHGAEGGGVFPPS